MEVRIVMSASPIVTAVEALLQSQSQITSQVVQTPGKSDQSVTIDAQGIYAQRGHSCEIGIVLVDDATGKIGSLSPGDAGYAQAALSSTNHKVLLTSADGRHPHGEVTIPGGSYYILYFIEDGTAADVLSNNPNNVSGQQPVAQFSLPAANQNGQSELSHRFGLQYAWGNAEGNSFFDLPESVFRLHIGRPVSPPDTTPPHSSLSITGTVPTTTDEFDVHFTEPMKLAALRKKNYTLTLTSGPNAGTTIPIQFVTHVDSSTVHIILKNPLAPGNYRFDIDSGLTDRAGNSLANPRSFTFTVA
ncbi:MAG: repeat-containing protein [Schlesneria sp.]|nr:repeat-containing protein [Schlesneria sp.]